MKWTVYTRGTIPLHRLSCAIKAINEFSTRLTRSSFKSILYANEGSKFWWAWDAKELEDLGRNILKKTKTEKGKARSFNTMRSYSDRAINSSQRIRELDLRNLSNEEIIKSYKDHFRESAFAHALMDTDIDAVDVLPAEILKQMIKRELPEKTTEK